MSLCDKCGGPMLFGRTTAGRAMPMDPERYQGDDPAANLAVSRDHLGRLLVRVLKKGEAPESYEWRGMPHFATCPPLVAERDAKAGRLRDQGVIPLFPPGSRRGTN